MANITEMEENDLAQQRWALDQQPMVVGPGVGGEEPMSLAWFAHAYQYAVFNQQTFALLMLSNIAVFLCGENEFFAIIKATIDGSSCA